MAEGPALEKRYPAKSGIVGSNPTLSAKLHSSKVQLRLKTRIRGSQSHSWWAESMSPYRKIDGDSPSIYTPFINKSSFHKNFFNASAFNFYCPTRGMGEKPSPLVIPGKAK